MRLLIAADAYTSYKKFARCDDASIGQEYSDKIAQLLSDKWSKVAELDRLAARDKGFERFVLRHVDELTTDEHAKKICENAQKTLLAEKLTGCVRQSSRG